MRDTAEEIRKLMKDVFGITKFDLEASFPDVVYLLQDAQCRVYQVKQELKKPDGVLEFDTWGVVCFSEEFIGNMFIKALERHDLEPTEMTFTEARELAQSKDVPCLFLLDDPENITVHWVK
jgi:hypothetical protein